jgi:hypothetical protein
MAMCLELGDNSIHYPVGIAKDAPVKVGEIKFNIYGERSAFNFQPLLEVCNSSMLNMFRLIVALSGKSWRRRKQR